MLIRIKDRDVEEAAERVRRKRGDKSRTETVVLLIGEADRGPCRAMRGDGRECGAPIGPGDGACIGCITSTPPETVLRGDLVQRNGNGDVIARMNRATGDVRRVVPPKRARKGAKS